MPFTRNDLGKEILNKVRSFGIYLNLHCPYHILVVISYYDILVIGSVSKLLSSVTSFAFCS